MAKGKQELKWNLKEICRIGSELIATRMTDDAESPVL